MLDTISKSDIADLRAVLTDAGYATDNLATLLGTADPPSKQQLPGMLHRTRTPSALHALLRLFLIGATVPEDDARAVLPHNLVDMCLQTGILDRDGEGLLQADIVIVPVANLLFASDAFRVLGGAQQADFVLPASTRAGTVLRRLTLHSPVDRTLDLGCGCGLHALLAARHSRTVIATDLSKRALRYTEFNAMLNNIENVECREGDLFEPVSGESFERIVTNPPFVIGPGEEFTYRDNRMELDDFCRQIAREAPAHLAEGGCLQMLCEWVATSDQPWQERLREWTQDTGCDAWVLRFPLSVPVDYVTRRSTDISGGGYRPGTSFEAWIDYFEERDVSAVYPGMIVLRRRDGDNWFRAHTMPQEPDDDAGGAIERNIAANDFASLCDDDATLLEAVLAVSPDLYLEQRFARDAGGWDEGVSVLQFDGPLPLACEVDLPVLVFLNQVDGKRTVAENVTHFAQRSGADRASVELQLLPAVRLFIRHGFLEAVES